MEPEPVIRLDKFQYTVVVLHFNMLRIWQLFAVPNLLMIVIFSIMFSKMTLFRVYFCGIVVFTSYARKYHIDIVFATAKPKFSAFSSLHHVAD